MDQLGTGHSEFKVTNNIWIRKLFVQARTLTQSEELDYGANWIQLWRKGRFTYRIGFDLNRRDVRSDENLSDGISSSSFTSLSGDQKSIAGFVAGFVDSQWQGRQFTGHLGARFTRIAQDSNGGHESDSKWIGTASLKYQVNKDWYIYGQLGTGFRFPELTEKFFNGTTGRGQVIGSPDLEPEDAVNQEVGFLGQLRLLHVKGSLFRTRVRDYIGRIPVADRVLSFANLASGTIERAEVSVDYSLSDAWLVSLQGHWLNGEDSQNKNLADINPPRIGIHLNYTDSWGDLNVAYRHRFATDRVSDQELPIDRFDRLSASLRIEISSDFELKLWADNILNDKFRRTP